jgi:outer membrane scaffolding protein for murein synthesis (MipA/OmpV family)
MDARLLLLLAPVCAAMAAGAAPAAPELDEEDPPPRYVIGLAATHGPEYEGARRSDTRLRPVWAARLGRFRITTSGGSALLGFGREEAGAGASTQLVDSGRWRLGVAARVDSGRDSGEADTTRGLPDVRRTLRVRVYANYALGKDWHLGASASQDVLGRGGGLVVSAGSSWRLYRSASTEWTSGIGISAASAQYLRSYFGVPPAAATLVRPAYEPGAGLHDLHASLGFKHLFAKDWFLFGSAGASRLLGPAADSPLVEQRAGASVTLGVAWRN